MEQRREHTSHLFTLRIWQEELGNGEMEWRSRVHHVMSGEVRYFRDWPSLIAFLLVLSNSEVDVDVQPDWDDTKSERGSFLSYRDGEQ